MGPPQRLLPRVQSPFSGGHMTGKGRWEQGSEFPLIFYSSPIMQRENSWGKKVLYLGSGRDALRSLLVHGLSNRGWRRLLVPSYYCQEVLRSLISTGIQLEVYPDGPEEKIIPCLDNNFKPGDVLLVVNYFGLRSQISYRSVKRDSLEIIEDHTHDPWSNWARNSSADWCIASLRKVLPLPDGGVLWSPSGEKLPLPSPLSPQHYLASLKKLGAMALKKSYLEGCILRKEVYRQLALSGEKAIGAGEVSGMSPWSQSLLDNFPLEQWREVRKKNHKLMTDSLQVSWARVLQGQSDSSCPFSGVIVFDKGERREYVREKLILSNIYPAVLWPLEEAVAGKIPKKHLDFSRKMLSVHCDMRYNFPDIFYVTSCMRRFGEEYR